MEMVIKIFGTIAAILSLIGTLPQLYKIYKIKSAEDISTIMLMNGLAAAICWLIYGIASKSSFIIYSNILGVITSIISIAQKIYYNGKKSLKSL